MGYKVQNFAELARIQRILDDEAWSPTLRTDYGMRSMDLGYLEALRCPRCGALDTRDGSWCYDCGRPI